MGRKQFEQVVAQASREQLKQYDHETNTVISANGGIEEILVYASPSNIAKIVGLYVDVPPTASTGATGYQDLYFSYKVNTGSGNVNLDIAHGASGPSKNVTFQDSIWQTADSGTFPDNSTVGSVMQNVQFDSVVPFRIAYSNGTTVASNGGNRRYHITYIEREVRL